MPSGYTAVVASGEVTDFRTFALRCARAFGATIMQREAPMDEPPVPREPSPYHAQQFAAATSRLADLHNTLPQAAQQLAEDAYTTALAWYEEHVAEMAATRARYEAMLVEVILWRPPTAEHEALQRFMVDQLRDSMGGDVYEPTAPTRSTGPEWLAAQIAQAERDIAYHAREAEAEDRRVAESNAWVAALYSSLPKTEVPADA